MRDSFCSRLARSSEATLTGTATEASIWLLIEMPGPWGGKAVAESDLAPEVRSRILNWEAEADSRRAQFIRRELTVFDKPGSITVFVGYVDSPPGLYRFHFDDYADLLEFDLERASERPFPVSSLCTEPIFLTCTNGRRDACCAKWGREMAAAMSTAAADRAWQTTHLGGHRFAPTVLVLPHGSQYGWLAPDEAVRLVEAHCEERLYRLDRYRGHVGFARPVQAAAIFVRENEDRRAVNALSLLDAVRERTTWQVRLRSGAEVYEVQVVQKETAPIIASCGSDLSRSTCFVPERYRVV